MARDPARRDSIIQGAAELFMLAGYGSVTVEQICLHTSSTKGSFYHFFRSKEDLAVQLVDAVWHQTRKELVDILTGQTPGLERIRKALEFTCHHSKSLNNRRQFTGCPVGSLAVSLGSSSQKVRRRINFAFDHIRQLYAVTFTEAIASGEVDTGLSAMQLAELTLGVIQGASVIGRSHNSNARVNRLIDSLMLLLGEEPDETP